MHGMNESTGTARKEKQKRRTERARLFFELGSLKETQRSGLFLLGEKDGDSIAAHSWRAAVIAFYLAKRVGADPYKAMAIAVVHDMPEARTGDINKVMNRYVVKDEKRAFDDMLKGVDELEEFKALLDEYNSSKANNAKTDNTTLEGKVGRDADLLDMIFQALVLVERGNKLALEWAINAKNALQLEEAKKIAEEAFQFEHPWWKGVKKLD